MLGLPRRAEAPAPPPPASLALFGGGPITGLFLDFLREGPCKASLAAGKKPLIVVITSAAQDGPGARQGWEKAFAKDEFEIAFIHTRKEADSVIAQQLIRRAAGVMLGGGDQANLVPALAGTKAQEAIFDQLGNPNFTLGATSAGTAACPIEMIENWENEESVERLRPEERRAIFAHGLGFINAITDTHLFCSRIDRTPRLTDALARHPDLTCIGLGEGSGLIIQRSHARVVGENQVEVLRSGPNGPEEHIYPPGREFPLDIRLQYA
ncbi:MAG: Type 1 glutamine amidotransferase-like domain-containing protein, partial [Alphaproteobacteria bacterium]|nr:Type 1 glutamine amidotransferase-like domain-containing protein [Alphaproteobacteria bacterium]